MFFLHFHVKCTDNFRFLSHTIWAETHIPARMGGKEMRNKAKNFSVTTVKGEAGKARAKAAYASKRADGTINTHPQERMKASTDRTE